MFTANATLPNPAVLYNKLPCWVWERKYRQYVKAVLLTCISYPTIKHVGSVRVIKKVRLVGCFCVGSKRKATSSQGVRSLFYNNKPCVSLFFYLYHRARSHAGIFSISLFLAVKHDTWAAWRSSPVFAVTNRKCIICIVPHFSLNTLLKITRSCFINEERNSTSPFCRNNTVPEFEYNALSPSPTWMVDTAVSVLYKQIIKLHKERPFSQRLTQRSN